MQPAAAWAWTRVRIRRLRYRLGRRGAFLFLIGFMWLGYGYGQIVQPPPTASQVGLKLLTAVVPYQHLGWLWIAVSIVAFASAPQRPGRDTSGFVALIAPPMLWMFAYLTAWWPLAVFPRGWVAAAIWAAATAMILVVAGWPEPDRRRP